MREGQKGVMIYVPKDLHRRFKIRLAETGQTQSAVIQGYMERWIHDTAIKYASETKDHFIEPAEV